MSRYTNPNYRKDYYEKNKEAVVSKSKDYYAQNKDDPEFKAKRRQYYLTAREKVLAKRKAEYHESLKHDPVWVAKNKEWRQNNPEKMQEHRKAWERKNPTWAIYHNAKRRARDAEVPFDIKFTDIVIPTHCPVLNIPLDGLTRETGPSLDRIKPELGYVVSNVQVISMRANMLKSDATLQELESLVRYVKMCS